MIIENPTPELINQNIINTLEDNLHTKLPNSYKSFLLKTNGGSPINIYFMIKSCNRLGAVQNFFGMHKQSYRDIFSKRLIFIDRIPPNTLAISSQPNGDLILLSVSGSDYGKIYYWDHDWEVEDGEIPDYSNLTLIADSFDEFISMLKSEEEIEAIETGI